MEHGTAEGDNQNLTDEDETCNREETAAAFEVEGTAVGHEGSGVEHVPELDEHEESEEEAQFKRRESLSVGGAGGWIQQVGASGDVVVLQENQQDEQQGGEDDSHASNHPCHRAVDDEVGAGARCFVHDVSRGRQRCQCHGCKSVHDEVHPQHLRNGVTGSEITPGENNYVIGKNDKIEQFEKNDSHGVILTIMAMAIVFSALIVLSICFFVFGTISKRMSDKKKKGKKQNQQEEVQPEVAGDAEGEVVAAIAMALYEHLNAHDEESNVLTFKRRHSDWNSKIATLTELSARR